MASASFDLPEMRGRVCCQRVNSSETMGLEMALNQTGFTGDV